ncbi:hypothetical protein GJ744_011068 [Endocarpon pusillum]|uniref:Zn(2)-C6 fungal-type domain-containing protein n=1 Tax=Endocarpon pusillum TaxID=364733 RepID=A0A8H7E2G2_9EURO|nr:hypothetical protein GJ744_011068 [Endocarpon pusillum]
MDIDASSLRSQPRVSPIKGTRPKDKEFQRAYKACIACRRRKARCDLGINSSPPCARCRREHRECVFSSERNYNSVKRHKNDQDGRRSFTNRLNHTRYLEAAVDGRGSDTVAHEGEHQLSTETHSQDATPKANLAKSVMQTVVSNGNDALNILFEAAAHQELADHAQFPKSPPPGPAPVYDTPRSVLSLDTAASASRVVKLSQPNHETLKLWSQTRFVMNGWLSAQEAVTFIDLFFQNMSPLSPIVTNYYQDHAHHFQLTTEEPLLITVLLMISSRYHLLPCPGAASRGFFMHERFWHHCQNLIQRILYGQEKSSNAKSRAIGSIEALLLICEWHPRALHFPHETEGWDTSIYVSQNENDGKVPGSQPVSATSTRWLEDVIEPARRSDRMSWMLLGTALTLAHELGVFDDDEKAISTASPMESKMDPGNVQMRKLRMRKLLYVYINQLASRLGCLSMFPQNLTQAAMATASPLTDKWQSHMSSWIELTKLVKSASELFFPSPLVTRQLLSSGRYSSLLDHFIPLLEQWRRKHLDSHDFQGPYQDTLFIEYHYARIYINSIGMQAVCQRALSEMDSGLEANSLRTTLDGQENGFINEVIGGGIEILERTIRLAETDTLRFSPVRTFLRITTSSVFLLKAISLGIRNAKLQRAFSTLDKSIQAMRISNLDDMHLAARYATLLETHVSRLRRGFVASTQKQSRLNHTVSNSASQSEADSRRTNGIKFADASPPPARWDLSTNGPDMLPLQELSADDWLSLPFDPSMAPFGADESFGFSAFDENALDFIWNLPAG